MISLKRTIISKNNMKIIIAVIAIIILLMLFTPLNISQYQLNAAQRQSLCDALVDTDPDDWGDGKFRNSAVLASVDIFGISGFGKNKTVYGYLDEGLYVEANGKGYDISGGLFEFMVDIETDGDKVSIIKEYGDGVSTMTTLKEMPLLYRCKWEVYVGMGMDQWLRARTQKRVKDILGVPADTINTLSIDEEEGTYMIYDWNNEKNEPDVKYQGKITEL